MNPNKEAFLLYKGMYEPVKNMTLEQKGLLFDAIYEYQISGQIPAITDGMVLMAFKFFENQFRIDEEKYEAFRQKQSENGKLGGRPRSQKTQAFSEKPKNPSLFSETQKSLNDNDNVNVNDHDHELFSKNEDKDKVDIIKAQLHKLGFPEISAETVLQNIPVEWLNNAHNVLEYIAEYINTTYGKKTHQERNKLYSNAIRNPQKWQDLYANYHIWLEKRENAEKVKTAKSFPPVCPICGEKIDNWGKCVKGCGFYKYDEKAKQQTFYEQTQINIAEEFKKALLLKKAI